MLARLSRLRVFAPRRETRPHHNYSGNGKSPIRGYWRTRYRNFLPRPSSSRESAAASRSDRLRETRGPRLPLRRVFRLWIGIGSLWNLDGPRRSSPPGRGCVLLASRSPLIRKERGNHAQGFDLCFHPRQLDFFQPENLVSVFHEPNLSENQRLAHHVPSTLPLAKGSTSEKTLPGGEHTF